MAAEDLKRDQNNVTVLGGVTDDSNQYVTMLRVDPTTKRLLVSATGSGSGSVTSVSVISANGFAGTVATATTTPAITLSTTITGFLQGNGTAISAATTTGSGSTLVLSTSPTLVTPVLGVATATSINGLTITSSTGTLTITNAKTLSISNTLTLAGTDGTTMTFPSTSASIARTDAANTFTGTQTFNGTVALGAQSLTMTGSIAATGARVTKGWFTDIESTNAPTVGGVSLPTATSTTTFTNKRITQRVVTTTDDATAVIDVDVTDLYELSAIANNTTFTLTGTPTDGQKLIIRYKDAGVSKTLTWTGFTAIGITLPTATSAGKWGLVGCIYNLAATQWQAVTTTTEA